MMTPRAIRSIVRLTPLAAWLVVSAFVAPHASAAGCAHPALSHNRSSAAASLQILEIAESDGTNWTHPGAPCNGPRCRSKAPTAPAPGVFLAASHHHDAAASATAPPPPTSSIAMARNVPPLRPIDAVSALERPPREA